MGSEPIKKHGKSIPFENDMFLYISETGKYDSVLPSRSRLPSSVKHTATPPQPLHFYKGNGYSKTAKTTNGTKKCSYFTVSYDARRHDSQKEREPRNSKFNCGICTFWKEPGSPKALFWDRGHTHRHTDRDESAAGRALVLPRGHGHGRTSKSVPFTGVPPLHSNQPSGGFSDDDTSGSS